MQMSCASIFWPYAASVFEDTLQRTACGSLLPIGSIFVPVAKKKHLFVEFPIFFPCVFPLLLLFWLKSSYIPVQIYIIYMGKL